MTMTKGQRLALGLASLIPLLYLLVVVLTPLRVVFTSDPASPDAPDWFLYFTAFHFFMYLYTGLLFAFYVIHLLGNRELSKERKALWAFAFLFFSVLSMPLYWYLHIWRSES
ncbi:hypothetical protein [Hydrogenivirga sp. 128-5-R1-1]|uniref:hypothetical protein n=1 Tax=Hydrogenivirga sp. 128-5-R1-1 TaxID=392423 RepID=UPI0012FB88C5|nr:hypothetical protein [Hydrogenivirga sp. 128-5-R1-1]